MYLKTLAALATCVVNFTTEANAASYISECARVLDPAVFSRTHSVVARYALAEATRDAAQFNQDGSLNTWIPVAGVAAPLGLSEAFSYSQEYARTLNVNWSRDEYESYYVREIRPFQASAFSDCVKRESMQTGAGVHLELWKDLGSEVLVKVVIHPDALGLNRKRYLYLTSNGEFASGIGREYDAGEGEDFVRIKWPNLGRTLNILAQMRTAPGRLGQAIGQADALLIPPKITEVLEYQVAPVAPVTVQGGWNRVAREEQRSSPAVITAGENQLLLLETLDTDVVMRGDLGKAPGPNDYGVGFHAKNPKTVSLYSWCAWQADEICTVTASFKVDRVTFAVPPDQGPPMTTMSLAPLPDAPEVTPVAASPEQAENRRTLIQRARDLLRHFIPTYVSP